MKKVLTIYYSQAGQTQRAVESFLRGFGKSVPTDSVAIEPLEKFDFPWSIRNFFRVMPRCVQRKAPEIKPLQVNWENYEFVILAYQVWFLSPSLPLQGFLNSPSAGGLKGKKVLALATCRNLWRSAALTLVQMLKKTNCSFLGQITLCELSPLWASFVTTPRWMLKGKKSPFWFFPAAGIEDQEFEKLEEKAIRIGRMFAQTDRISRSELCSNLNRPSLDKMEQIGFPFFRLWSAWILWVAPQPNFWQDFWLLLFRLNLVLLIVCVAPCTKLYEIYGSFYQRIIIFFSKQTSQ